MSKAKVRVDILLVERELASSLEEARRYIMAGYVFTDHKRLEKPGDKIPASSVLFLKGIKPFPWVSRGGVKLAHGINHFHFPVKEQVALDVGCSTGGFTDVLLHHEAARIYAVDVGYGELDWKLRQDPRVVLLERTNARHLNNTLIPEAPQCLVCDASFIRLQSVLEVPLTLMAPTSWMIALIKPQFQVMKAEVGEGGIIRDALLHARVCEEVATWLSQQPGWHIEGIIESPILGAEGNKEFLLGAQKQ